MDRIDTLREKKGINEYTIRYNAYAGRQHRVTRVPRGHLVGGHIRQGPPSILEYITPTLFHVRV